MLNRHNLGLIIAISLLTIPATAAEFITKIRGIQAVADDVRACL
jgi:ABC-type Mn2+/Zn2+ transport system permease subunit